MTTAPQNEPSPTRAGLWMLLVGIIAFGAAFPLGGVGICGPQNQFGFAILLLGFPAIGAGLLLLGNDTVRKAYCTFRRKG